MNYLQNYSLRNTDMKRRKFIEIASIGSAAMASSFYLPYNAGEQKLKVGLIGTGWYGMVDIKAALKTGSIEVIGICDVDTVHLSSATVEIEKIQGSKPKAFKYFRELLNMKDLEAVFIATPPHWHALQFIAACKKGLDIYCEKPLSYDVSEGHAMVTAAEKAGNIVQVGFQRRQSGAFKKAKELIETGKIGQVRQVIAQINYIPVPDDTTIQAPPASLDWEEWCVAAYRKIRLQAEYRP